MSRKVETTLDDVLSMVSCAEDYGHTNQIAMYFFWTLAGERVSDEEIEAFLQKEFLTDEARLKGYTDEDADSSREIIREWRARHTKEPR